MRLWVTVLILFLSLPANAADCGPLKPVLATFMASGFLPFAEYTLNEERHILLISPGPAGGWIDLRKDGDNLCIVNQDFGFHLYYRRQPA